MFTLFTLILNESYSTCRANEWNLDNPDWVGRLRLLGVGNKCVIKLEDKNTGELFAKAPIDDCPGPAIEAVSDSSRYFVLRIQDDNSKHYATIIFEKQFINEVLL